MSDSGGRVGDHQGDGGESVTARGLDRRSLIKRAAAAGAAAWTAPVILDSLASPAAAGTCGTIYRVEIRMNANCSSTLNIAVGAYVGTRACTSSDYAVPPSAYTETVVNLNGNQADCITMSGTCSADGTGTATATLTTTGCTPGAPVSGCSTPLRFLGAGQYGLYLGGTQVCLHTPYDVDLNPVGPGGITWVGPSTVDFEQPVSDRTDTSGAWQFVVGCSCT